MRASLIRMTRGYIGLNKGSVPKYRTSGLSFFILQRLASVLFFAIDKHLQLKKDQEEKKGAGLPTRRSKHHHTAWAPAGRELESPFGTGMEAQPTSDSDGRHPHKHAWTPAVVKTRLRANSGTERERPTYLGETVQLADSSLRS